MNDVLFHLCRHCVGIMDGWMPYPAWCIAKQCGISVSTVRRRLRKLKADGYVDTTVCYWSEQEEPLPPYNGWTITSKAETTPEYKIACEEEIKLCRDVFGEHMFPDERLEEMQND